IWFLSDRFNHGTQNIKPIVGVVEVGSWFELKLLVFELPYCLGHILDNINLCKVTKNIAHHMKSSSVRKQISQRDVHWLVIPFLSGENRIAQILAQWV